VFETVCDKLGLASCDHKAAQTVAKIIIELEQRGVREPAMLRKMTATLFRRWREAAAVTQCEVTEPRKGRSHCSFLQSESRGLATAERGVGKPVF
jgi:hypothetical protein